MKLFNYNQYKYSKKYNKKFKTKSPALQANPQKKGICLKVYITPPKKPNSAKRKIARVRLSNNQKPIVYIPGQGHNLQQFSWVLVRGGRVKDLPGVRYKMVRNKYDLQGILHRRRSRSKYGTKLWVGNLRKRTKVYKYK